MKYLITIVLLAAGLSAIAGGGITGGSGGSGGAINGGGTSTSGTNFAGILVTNTAYAANFVATGTGQTNVFDVTLFTNGLSAYVSSIDTNTAQINGGLTNLVLNTVYTNANQRSFLVGSLYAICTATLDAGAVIYYTNNGVAQNLSIIAAHHSVTPGTNQIPFTIPLSPNATYRIQTNGVGTCFPTNVFLWRL